MALRNRFEKRGEPGKMNGLRIFFLECCLECKYFDGINKAKPCRSNYPCLGKTAFDYLRDTMIRKTVTAGEKSLHTPMKSNELSRK